MKLQREDIEQRAKAAGVRAKILSDLRWPAEGVDMENREFAVVTDKSGNIGILITDQLVVAYRLVKRASRVGGRIEPIICDLCNTWRRGSESAIMTLGMSRHSTRSYLVCSDLACSDNVRGITDAALLSKTQLRETLVSERKIERLQEKLAELID